MREFSLLAIVLGVLIGVLLAAANAFVGLKVGMTISASIPAAVVSLLVMRKLLNRGTILENNIVQTVGSAGESVAAGMIFTLPALFIMGQNPTYLEMAMWAAIGGILGVCFMVPLRRVLIVREHGILPFPEGVACAEVLRSGEKGGSGARSIVWGSIVGGVYHLINALGFWKETGVVPIERIRSQFALDSSPALLGVGYILGPRIAAYMLSGAFLGWFILIPSMAYFGAQAQSPVFPSSQAVIADMTPSDLWQNYIRYIGAGAVAIGGLISLVKSLPTICSSFWHVAYGVLGRDRRSGGRADRDIPFILLVLIIAGLACAMWRLPQIKLGHVGAVAVVVFTFFFVTVSSRLVGIVGSSSNPISGMTIATLLATALIFKYFVIGDVTVLSDSEMGIMKVSCLSAGALVCIAIAVAGDCSQDLKTGFLLEATPYKQQIGEMIGVLSSVFAISGVLLLLNRTFGFGAASPEHPFPLLAPQANIMKILVEGVLGGNVPWTLITIGGAGAVIVEMLGLPALPFAVGLYLPLGLSTPIMVGGIVRWLVHRKKGKAREHDPGVLSASGLVAGYGLTGVALAGVLALIVWLGNDPHWVNPSTGAEEAVSYGHFATWLWSSVGFIPSYWGLSPAWWNALPFIPFLVLVIWLWWHARNRGTTGPLTADSTIGGRPRSPAQGPQEVPPQEVTRGLAESESEQASQDEALDSDSDRDSESAEEFQEPPADARSTGKPLTGGFPPLPPIPDLPPSLRNKDSTGHAEGVERFPPSGGSNN